MSHTFGFTGMDPATETSLRVAFVEASKRLGGGWMLRPDDQAEFVVVDMDSMYGPMSWLRMHAAGRTVIGLTSAARSQTPFRLARPFDIDSVAELLREIEHGPAEAAVPSGMTPSPQPQDLLPEEVARKPDEERASPGSIVPAADEPMPPVIHPEPPSAAAGRIVPPAPTIAPRTPPLARAGLSEPQTLGEWLGSGKLVGKLRIERAGKTLLLDAAERQYFGPALLKPLEPMFSGVMTAADFQPVDAGTFAVQAATMGEAHSLLRLLWLGALLAGQGQLTPGFSADGRYQMLKWPQTEREFPKHFRIATAMMKGPATLAELASSSGVPLNEVIDFVNASLATGFVIPFRDNAPTTDPPKSGGLFGRLRGR